MLLFDKNIRTKFLQGLYVFVGEVNYMNITLQAFYKMK